MASATQRPAILAGAAALVALIALFLPWWTVHTSVSGNQFGNIQNSSDVHPFSDGVDGTVLTGVFWVIGLVAAVAATVLLLVPTPLPKWLAPTLTGAAGLLFLLMPLLAIVTWPGSDGHFWGSATSGGGSFGSVGYSAYANVGWYLALACGVTCAVAAFLAMGRSPTAPTSAPVQEPVATPTPTMEELQAAPTRSATPRPTAKPSGPKKVAAAPRTK